jgi:hypothetical protein
MCKKIWTITKINLKNNNTPYFVTGLNFAIVFVQNIIYTIISFSTGKAGEMLNISSGNYFWLLIIFAAIFIPTKNYRRIINLGVKRKHFFWGNLEFYAVLAGAVTVANTAFYYIYDRFLLTTGYYIGYNTFVQNTALMDTHFVSVNLIELFGWSVRGIFFAVVQQFAFLFLLAVVVHTITSIQDKWYGWVVDVLIAAILSVFIPIAPLRACLVWFFYIIIFNSNPLAQITVCMLLAVAIYSLNKPIFARKAI